MYVRPRFFAQGFRLFDRQAEAILCFEEHGRLAGPIGVGHGKTGIGLMCAQSAYETHGHSHIVLLQPPNTVPQLMKRDLPFWRARVNVSLPVHNLHGRGPGFRRRMAAQRPPGLYVMPYSLLSAQDAEELLEALRPSFVAMDECHNLKDQQAARTKRMLRYIRDHEPEMLMMSGTMTDKRLADYAHLMLPCLRDLAPIPQNSLQLMDWASFIDADAGEPLQSNLWKMAPLLNWYQREFPGVELKGDQSGIRRAFRVRLTTSPAVVASADDDIGVSLNLQIEDPLPDVEKMPQPPAGYVQMKALMDQVDQAWLSPSGDEIDYAIHKWRYLYELSSGIYYRLQWPTHPNAELLDRSQTHHFLKQEYHRLLRDYLNRRSRPKLDTPFLVGSSFVRHQNNEVGEPELYDAWLAMKELETPDLIERDSIPVRVCDYKIRRAVEWAAEKQKQKTGCILWYHHRAVGVWLAEMAMQEGLDVLHCPAGNEHNAKIIDPANADQVVIASMRAHGEGKNLQHHQHAYFVQVPRQAKLLQQTIGRLHRKGQPADELTMYLSLHGIFDDLQLSQTLVDAVYQHTTLAARQKVIDGNWLTDPRIFPPQLLNQKGLQCRRLDTQEEEAYRTKFGEYV